MAPAPSRAICLLGRPAATPVAPLLSPTTCVWSVSQCMPTDRPSARSTLSSIHNADLDREMARRWLDEDYDFYAPEEVARRNELYEAFARRVAALQSADVGLGEQTDVDEYKVERDEAPVVNEIAVSRINSVKNKVSVPELQAPAPAISDLVVPESEAQPTQRRTINSRTRITQVLETESKSLPEPHEKSVAEVLDHRPKPVRGTLSTSLSEIQRQELEMVKEYLAKVAADFEWESTASQGLRPTSEDGAIGLSAYMIAFGFEKAVKNVCGVLSVESPFEAKPTAIDDDDEPLRERSSRKAEKGVLCAPPRRFNGLPDAVLNRSRETLIEELQRMKNESATPLAEA